MTSRLEVILLGAEIHLDADRREVGTATFRRADDCDGAQPFHVEMKPEQAIELMTSTATKFAIVIELAAAFGQGVPVYRLMSAEELLFPLAESARVE